MNDPGKSVGKLVTIVFESAERYRLENEILRTLLLEKGLSRKQIAREVRGYLRKHKVHESAVQTFATSSQQIREILADLDLSKQVAKLGLPPKHKMN